MGPINPFLFNIFQMTKFDRQTIIFYNQQRHKNENSSSLIRSNFLTTSHATGTLAARQTAGQIPSKRGDVIEARRRRNSRAVMQNNRSNRRTKQNRKMQACESQGNGKLDCHRWSPSCDHNLKKSTIAHQSRSISKA